MNKSIEKILIDIIKHELNLPDNYGTTSRGDVIPTVIIYGQNIKLFNTDKLQVTVRTVSAKTYSNRSEFKENPNAKAQDGSDAFIEIQDVNQQRLMQIDCYSRNNDARERFWEITAALKSNYAEQQMDKYNFKIGTMTNDINLSGIDGGSDINRYTVSFNVLVHYQKQKFIDYYNKFPSEVYTEKGKIAEFQIPEE